MNRPETHVDRRAQRRATTRAHNRTEILDAAEQVFGENGIRDGSLRKIADTSGFSTAAIYLFFENKQHLLAETLTRRGDELIQAMRTVADSELGPLDKLHRIVDVTVEFFADRPHFRLLLRHIRGGADIVGPVLAEFAGDVHGRFVESMTLLARIVHDGQAIGEIREGDERALAHMYSVLVNEHVLLDADADSDASYIGTLTSTQFHALVDGALRRPATNGGRTTSGTATRVRRRP